MLLADEPAPQVQEPLLHRVHDQPDATDTAAQRGDQGGRGEEDEREAALGDGAGDPRVPDVDASAAVRVGVAEHADDDAAEAPAGLGEQLPGEHRQRVAAQGQGALRLRAAAGVSLAPAAAGHQLVLRQAPRAARELQRAPHPDEDGDHGHGRLFHLFQHQL